MKKRIKFCPLYQQWYKKTSLIAGSLSPIGYGNQQPRINSFLINQWKEVYEIYKNELIKVQRLSKPQD